MSCFTQQNSFWIHHGKHRHHLKWANSMTAQSPWESLLNRDWSQGKYSLSPGSCPEWLCLCFSEVSEAKGWLLGSVRGVSKQ